MTKDKLKVFLSYSHEDKVLMERLSTALAALRREEFIHIWSDKEILPGEDWNEEIAKNFRDADIILLLISPDFIASDYIYQNELANAMERHKAGDARVIPIIMRPCDWRKQVYGRLQALPDEVKPITRWDDTDEAIDSAVQGIRRLIESFRESGVT